MWRAMGNAARTLVRTVPATTRGRYLVVLPDPEGPAPLLVGFHGYGENAEMHLEKLLQIPGAGSCVVASVQALSRFYKTKTSETVGCWMTKLDRDQVILDNLRYVAEAVARIKEEHAPADQLVYAGFSQGGAMAYRAAARAGHECHGLIVLGRDVPPDVAEIPSVRLPPVLIGRGTRDQWYAKEKMEGDLRTLSALGVAAEPVVFEGGHEWSEEFLAAAGAFLRRVLGL